MNSSRKHDFVKCRTCLDFINSNYLSFCNAESRTRFQFVGGELGGKNKLVKWLSASFMVMLWFIYIALSSVQAYYPNYLPWQAAWQAPWQTPSTYLSNQTYDLLVDCPSGRFIISIRCDLSAPLLIKLLLILLGGDNFSFIIKSIVPSTFAGAFEG